MRQRSRAPIALGLFAAVITAAISLVFGFTPSVPFTTQASPSPTAWDPVASPEYYRLVGETQISWSLPAGSVEYGPLDSLGRATYAHAHITPSLAEAGSARERDNMADLSPTGWGHNAQVSIPLPDGSAYHGEFWNRSHLLAKSLGGQEVVQNIVCGTRMQNVGSNRSIGAGGMAHCENLARTWLSDHPTGSLLYAATPAYLGNEAVCRSVYVDVLASDGSINQRFEVYNTALGYTIDYTTGTFASDGTAASPDGVVTEEPDTPAESSDSPNAGLGTAAEAITFVLNTNSRKFHLPSCSSVADMSPKNRSDVTLSRDEVVALGYEPCGACKP